MHQHSLSVPAKITVISLIKREKCGHAQKRRTNVKYMFNYTLGGAKRHHFKTF